ncbi:MAG: hypothetical protein EBU88_14175 [Acidobacteria bacterium]|nr:hypothetical protein [Acidobacteriota bacterium]
MGLIGQDFRLTSQRVYYRWPTWPKHLVRSRELRQSLLVTLLTSLFELSLENFLGLLFTGRCD